jgi:hypothetical protein
MSSPKYFPGFEPSEIQNKIIPFLSRVNSSFPSGVIDRENWGLTSLRFQAKELCEELGYSRVSDFLRAYGFEIAESDFLTFDDYFSVGIHADEDKTDTSSKAKQEPVNHTRYMPKNSEKVSYAKEKKPAKFGLYIPILIIIALLCFGGYWAYQNYFQNFADNPRLIEKASDSVYILYCYDKNNKDPVSLGSGFAALEDELNKVLSSLTEEQSEVVHQYMEHLFEMSAKSEELYFRCGFLDGYRLRDYLDTLTAD